MSREPSQRGANDTDEERIAELTRWATSQRGQIDTAEFELDLMRAGLDRAQRELATLQARAPRSRRSRR